MPPKARITREMIVEAAFEIARSKGAEHVNVRTVSERLQCSTQPVLYHFKKMEEIRRAVYGKADEYHSAYIMDIQGDNPMKEIGLRYIRFAVEEKHLFRFLFQSDGFTGKSAAELINAEEIEPVIGILMREADIGREQAKMVFRSLFLIAHGYASMYANNEMEYDEEAVSSDLAFIFNGAVYAAKGGL